MNTIELRDQLITGILNGTIEEATVKLVFKVIDKFQKLSLSMAASNLDIVAEKQISKEEQKEEAKQRLEAGETVREVSQDLPERIVREASKEIVRDECTQGRTQECAQDVHESHANNVREVRKTKTEPILEPKKPVIIDGKIQTGDDPETESLSLKLIEKAKEVLGEEEYESMRHVYNDGHPYKDLCKYWDYMSSNAGWPARVDE